MSDDLKALVAVVEANPSLGRLPGCYVTQLALSQRLQQLEDILSAALFDWAQRPPAPTALGLRVYEHALPILRAVDGYDRIWAPAPAGRKLRPETPRGRDPLIPPTSAPGRPGDGSTPSGRKSNRAWSRLALACDLVTRLGQRRQRRQCDRGSGPRSPHNSTLAVHLRTSAF
jgi:hypothetical protein